jgi:signal transduction histidine kinase
VPRGLGLISIEERVAAFGGKMRFESTPGKGTTLTVELRTVDARREPAAAS